MKYCIIFLSLAVLFQGCIEKLSLPDAVFKKKMVVDGLLTNSSGPHKITLFFSNQADDETYDPITGAIVTLTDGSGTSYTFAEASNGEYLSDNGLVGQVGQRYTLHISLNGKEYTSTPQTMHPAGEIKNIYAEFDPGSINQHSFIGPHDSFSVWIDASPEQGSNHSFFRWRTKGTYEVRTFPELHEKPIPNTNPPIYIPDPLPCSGFYYDTIVQQVIRTGECECCNCWIDEYSQGTLVSDEKFVVNNEFNRVFVARIPADVERFYRKYYIQVEQLSISEDVHNFWQLVRSQQADRGVFQPNVSAVRGNIYNTDDSTDAVLGIFAVSAVSTTELMIDREDIPVDVGLMDTSTNACYKTYVGSTNIPPPFW